MCACTAARADLRFDYSESALRDWARKVRRWTREGRDVHVYFDNDGYGYAPRNAVRLADLVSRGR